MKNKLFLLLLTAINFAGMIPAWAQEEDECPDPPPPAHIDTSLYLLAGVALLLAWYVYSRKKLRKGTLQNV